MVLVQEKGNMRTYQKSLKQRLNPKTRINMIFYQLFDSSPRILAGRLSDLFGRRPYRHLAKFYTRGSLGSKFRLKIKNGTHRDPIRNGSY